MKFSLRKSYLTLVLLIVTLTCIMGFVRWSVLVSKLNPAATSASIALVGKSATAPILPVGTSASTPMPVGASAYSPISVVMSTSTMTPVGKSTSAPILPVQRSASTPIQATQALPDCCDISKGIDVEPFCNGSDTLSLKGCTCVDVLFCRMVAVTSLSSNHFAEAQDNLGSLQKYFPRTKIIVYDLGLTESHRRQLGTYCNVKLRNFTFEKYPDHVRNLQTYAWKPLVVSEVAREYDVILYGDASVRMKSSDMATVLKSIVWFPFLSGSPHRPAIISLTHDGMIQYLHSPPRKEMINFVGTEGGVWLMWANSVMKARVLSAWVDCALNKRCIAPEGAVLGPCNFSKAAFSEGSYVGCHRYDQSALNMILAREFGPSISPQIANGDLANYMWYVDRQATSTFKIQICKTR